MAEEATELDSERAAALDDDAPETLEHEKLAVLCEALDEGIAELGAGLGVETTPDELVSEIPAELDLDS